MARLRVGDREGKGGLAAPRASVAETVAGAGWHPDPFDLAEERWWNGSRWTAQVRTAPDENDKAAKDRDEAPRETVRGRPPGWYQWRGEVSRWWDGEKWGPARRPFADREETGPKARRSGQLRGSTGLAAVLVLVVAGVVLWIALGGGSSSPGLSAYQARIGGLCTRTFATERAEILKEGNAAVAGRKSHRPAVFVGKLLRTLVDDSADFDAQVQAIPPPSALRAVQQRYLGLEHQDSAIYGLVIPRIEGRGGLPALTTVTGLLSTNAQSVQRLLIQLGGSACSVSPLGLG